MAPAHVVLFLWQTEKLFLSTAAEKKERKRKKICPLLDKRLTLCHARSGYNEQTGSVHRCELWHGELLELTSSSPSTSTSSSTSTPLPPAPPPTTPPLLEQQTRMCVFCPPQLQLHLFLQLNLPLRLHLRLHVRLQLHLQLCFFLHLCCWNSRLVCVFFARCNGCQLVRPLP